MNFVPKTYKYTNIVDLTLSRDVADEFPLYIEADTAESLNYGQFKTLVRQATAGFLDIGLKKGDNVCLFAPNNMNYPAIALAILAAGGSLSPANPQYTAYELEKLLQLSKAKYLIAHSSNLDITLDAAKAVGIPQSNIWCIGKDPRGQIPNWKKVVVNGTKKEADPIKLTAEESRSTVAYICFSSGTTGPPKGVMLSHYNFIANNTEAEISQSQSAVHKMNRGCLVAAIPMFHMFGIIMFIHLSVLQGRTTVVMAKFDLEQLCQMIEKYKVTSMYGVPPMLLHLLNSTAIVDKYDLSSLEVFCIGAAPVSLELANRITQKFSAPVLQGYGMTETTSGVTISTIETYAPGSVGRMISCMEGKVVDEEGKDLPTGETGEICVRGPFNMLGYLNNPQATAETIDKDGFLHTGDIGYCDKLGNWYIVDRSKELIKYNALQIAPAELENVLLKCPLVADAAVIGIFDEKRQTEVPRAYVTLDFSSKFLNQEKAQEDIHKFVNEQVIQYKRLRGGIEFIDVIPKSVSGKILRKDLKEMYKNQIKASKAKL